MCIPDFIILTRLLHFVLTNTVQVVLGESVCVELTWIVTELSSKLLYAMLLTFE